MASIGGKHRMKLAKSTQGGKKGWGQASARRGGKNRREPTRAITGGKQALEGAGKNNKHGGNMQKQEEKSRTIWIIQGQTETRTDGTKLEQEGQIMTGWSRKEREPEASI